MIHQLKRNVRLSISISSAWEFFSDPRNLPLITPDWLRLTLTPGDVPSMYAGQILTYKVHPVFGIPLNWVTEITHVSAPHFFVDEQRVGPYKMWHHEHRFTEVNSGVEVEDQITYIMPWGPLGNILRPIFVENRLERIFDFRQKTLIEKFGVL